MRRERNDSENLNCWTLKLIVNRIHFIVTLIAKVIFSNICLLKTNSVTGWCIETVTQTEDYSTFVRNCLNSKLFFFSFHFSRFFIFLFLENSLEFECEASIVVVLGCVYVCFKCWYRICKCFSDNFLHEMKLHLNSSGWWWWW